VTKLRREWDIGQIRADLACLKMARIALNMPECDHDELLRVARKTARRGINSMEEHLTAMLDELLNKDQS